MEFRTQIPLQPQQHNQIGYNSNLLLLGSCFVENIGNKLSYFKFLTTRNPFGILFHPKAIENLLLNAINEKVFTEKDLFFHNEQWHCFEAHSKLSNPDKEVLLNKLNDAIKLANQQISKSTHLIITLGTAWVYRHIETDTFVANCHKVPQKKFLKELLSVDDITETIASILALIKSVNKEATVIFTVSPVRHVKDGFIENQQSKAHLISGIHHLINERDSFYFPSYEIVMDDLRDYRFYNEDMIHPSQTAINYNWEKFTEVWISKDTQQTMKEVESIRKALAHRPFHPDSIQHQKFLKNIVLQKNELQKKYPTIIF
jgi:hypothetical protein